MNHQQQQLLHYKRRYEKKKNIFFKCDGTWRYKERSILRWRKHGAAQIRLQKKAGFEEKPDNRKGKSN